MGVLGVGKGVGKHYDRRALGIQFGEELHHLLATGRVEGSRRFTCRNQLVPRQRGVRDRSTLMLTAGVMLRHMPRALADPHSFHGFAQTGFVLAGGYCSRVVSPSRWAGKRRVDAPPRRGRRGRVCEAISTSPQESDDAASLLKKLVMIDHERTFATSVPELSILISIAYGHQLAPECAPA